MYHLLFEGREVKGEISGNSCEPIGGCWSLLCSRSCAFTPVTSLDLDTVSESTYDYHHFFREVKQLDQDTQLLTGGDLSILKPVHVYLFP